MIDRADPVMSDPPWAGPPGFGIGLRRIDRADWLEGGEPRPWRRKDALQARVPHRVWGEVEGSRPGQAEAAGLVAGALGIRLPGPGLPPLLRAARRVPDDLVLMERRDGDWAVSALSLCAGSFFTADEALGRSLEALHGPVPGFRESLLLRVRRIFDNLPAGAVLERRNWTVTALADLHAPEAAAARALAARRRRDGAGRGFFLRCERQTLRRLPDTGGVLFTIRVHLSPLQALTAHPRALSAFARAWAEAPADFRRYKGLSAVAQGVEAFLSANRPETAARPSQGKSP